MGRNKIEDDKKKKSFTINIPIELYEELEKKSIKNKSQLFNWLLEQHFCIVDVEKGGVK